LTAISRDLDPKITTKKESNDVPAKLEYKGNENLI
jgi:hypothetical protein